MQKKTVRREGVLIATEHFNFAGNDFDVKKKTNKKTACCSQILSELVVSETQSGCQEKFSGAFWDKT